MEKMKAAVCPKYGPPEVLEIREIAKPVPGKNEVLIKIHTSTVSSADCRMRAFKVPRAVWIPARIVLGLRKPKRPVMGFYLAGVIETVGKNVKRFHTGDQIFARTGNHCGAYAEYICLPEDSLMALKPANVTFEEAVALPFGALTALYFLRKVNIRKGQKVLIYGASGATGTAAVQLAKYFGCEVTAVCSTANLGLVKSLGADRVIDYTKEDFTRRAEFYDIIFDAVGKISYSQGKKALLPNGKYVSVLTSGHAKGLHQPELEFIKELLENGHLNSVIDRTYPLEQIAEAHRYVDQGHKKGNVVITVNRWA